VVNLKLGLSNTSTDGGIGGRQLDANGMDDTVVAGNIDGEVRKCSESLLSENGVVHKILTELTRLGKRLALECGERVAGNSRTGNNSRNDAVVEHGGVNRSHHSLVRFNGGVSASKDSEGTSYLKCLGNTDGCEASREKTEVVVSLEVRLLLTDINTIGSPDLSGTFERSKSINNIGVHQGRNTREC
jgi:hypothetical protein